MLLLLAGTVAGRLEGPPTGGVLTGHPGMPVREGTSWMVREATGESKEERGGQDKSCKRRGEERCV